jgi:hypothetical protein
MSSRKKILWIIFPIFFVLVVLAGALRITASSGESSTTNSKPTVTATTGKTTKTDTREMNILLHEGKAYTESGYFEATSSSLVAAAAGDYNSKFYGLGQLLVKDGLSNTIISLGREMNGKWYEWSEHRAPPSEPDAYILAWRQIVKTLRSVPGQHFKFVWTLYPTPASVAESWPGSAYVDYIGTDIFDWYGGPHGTYPHTASGALDHQTKWQQLLADEPGGLNWMAAFSRATGKQIIIPEWGLDFHKFGGQIDPMFVTNMLAWMKAHDAIGLYWGKGHYSPASAVSGPVLVNQGASAQANTPEAVNGMGELMGGRLQYAGIYLPDHEWFSESVDQPVLAPWLHAGYRLVMSVPLVPNPVAIKSYSGPPEPARKPLQFTDYPDVVAAFRQGA